MRPSSHNRMLKNHWNPQHHGSHALALCHAEPILQDGNSDRRRHYFRHSRIAVLVVACGVLPLAVRPAPAQAIGQGFELERAGHHQQAVTVYLATVRADPTNVPALLGLERVLPLLGRLPELLPLAQHAVAASPQNGLLRALLLRTYVGLNEPDSARAAALRWVADAPGDEAPWREWAIALEDSHRHDAAREVLLAGRRALDRPAAFGMELADLLQRARDWA